MLYRYHSVFEYIPVESLIKEKQKEYYDALEKADSLGDSTVFVEFSLSIIHHERINRDRLIISNWSETSYGKIVSKRYLALYDCKGWSQSFNGNKHSEGGSVKRSIPETSANPLVGATFNVCRMQRLEVRDGMWRRFLKYPSERLERKIYFGEPISGAEWNDLAMSFEQIRHEGG